MSFQINDENLSYIKLPKSRQGFLLGLVFVLTGGILIVGWVPQQLYFNINMEMFLSLHMIVMLFSIVAGLTVAVAAWYDVKQTGSVRELILCLTFLIVGLVDVAHTLSYHGMPAFFTPNSLDKSTTYWVISRLVESVGLMLAVSIKCGQKKNLNTPFWVLLAIVLTGVVIVNVAYQVIPTPKMFIPDMGQTRIKVILDYVIIVIKGMALYLIIKGRRNNLPDYYLQAALIFGIFSEAAFTLYASAYDTYNFIGHIYKIFEFAYIMRALFVMSFVRLYQTNTVLHNQKKRMVDINFKLEKANKLKNEFLTNTNHELRTPLTAIIAFTELLVDKETGPLNEVQKDYINEINESSQQLLSYINNLLDLSKIEAGKIELHREFITIASLFNDVLRKTEPIFRIKKQKLYQEIDSNVPAIYIDKPKMAQVITNLLSNAHKFTPEEGEIRLGASLDRKKNVVIISVRDNGIGVSEEHQEQIFEKFVQVKGMPIPIHPGTGLGLALVKHLVGLHGGEVGVESQLGLGSNFYFSIPIVEEGKSEES